MNRISHCTLPVFALSAVCVWGLSACKSAAYDLANRPCDNGQCLAEYTCHPETNRCVPTIVVSCNDAAGVCPERTNARAPCANPTSFVPCSSAAVQCELGCRTCLADHTWSLCSSGPCGSDSDGDGVPDCIDDCPRVPDPSQADQDKDGLGDACDAHPAAFDFIVPGGGIVAGADVTTSSSYVARGVTGRADVSSSLVAKSRRFRVSGGVSAAASGKRRPPLQAGVYK